MADPQAIFGQDLRLLRDLLRQTDRNPGNDLLVEKLPGTQLDEPRVQLVNSVDVTPDPAVRTQININVSLTAIKTGTALNLVFPFSLEGGPQP